LQEGADVEERDGSGATPLWLAAKGGESTGASELLSEVTRNKPLSFSVCETRDVVERHEIPQLQFCFACHRRGQSLAIPLNAASSELDPALVRGGTFIWRSDEAHGIPRGCFGRNSWPNAIFDC